MIRFHRRTTSINYQSMGNRSIGEQVLTGIFIAGVIIVSPLVLLWKLLKWFTIAVTKEAGGKIVKIVGGAIGIATVAAVVQMIVTP